jgi:hypothetical protein
MEVRDTFGRRIEYLYQGSVSTHRIDSFSISFDIKNAIPLQVNQSRNTFAILIN